MLLNKSIRPFYLHQGQIKSSQREWKESLYCSQSQVSIGLDPRGTTFVVQVFIKKKYCLFMYFFHILLRLKQHLCSPSLVLTLSCFMCQKWKKMAIKSYQFFFILVLIGGSFGKIQLTNLVDGIKQKKK